MVLDSILLQLVYNEVNDNGYATERKQSKPVAVLAGNLPLAIREWIESEFKIEEPENG
jgi:hypothetical protein